MDIKLKKFDLLYESLINEKQSNFFAKVITDNRYLEEDFELVWEGSGFRKLILALSTALNNKGIIKDMVDEKLPLVDVEHMINKKSVKYEDLPAGTAGTNVGIRLTYDIFDEYKYPLLKTLIARNEASSDSLSNFGMFNDYLNKLVSDAETGKNNKLFSRIKTIKTDIKLEIIAIPESSKNDYSENRKHTKLSEDSFKCTIFLWFDSEAFKQELLDLMNDKNAAHPESTTGVSSDKTTENNEIEAIDKINFRNSKIKLGTETLTINTREIGNLGKLAKGLASNNLATPIANMLNSKLGITKIFGGNSDDPSEKGDKVKVNKHMWHSLFNLGDISSPYIYVKSIVTLDPWLYKDNFTKSVSDNKDNKVNYAIQLRKPFNEKYLKLDLNSPDRLTSDLSNGKNWTIDDHINGSEVSWPKIEDISSEMIQYLTEGLSIENIHSDLTKKVTCRWQYYLDSTRNMYSEYRVCINFSDFYLIIKTMLEKIKGFKRVSENIIDINFEELAQTIKLNPSELLQDKTSIDEDTEDIKDIEDTKGAEDIKDIEVTKDIKDIKDHKPIENIKVSKSKINISDLISYKRIVTFLNQSMDTITMGNEGPAYGSHKNNFSFLNNLFYSNTLLVKKIGSRELDYDYLNFNKLFSSWWTLRYVKENELGKRGNSTNTLITSNKHLYTNKGKSIDNGTASITRAGIPGFRDYDGNAADYFITNVFSKGTNLSVGSEELTTIFKEQLDNLLGELNIDILKDLFNKIKNFDTKLKSLETSKLVIKDKRIENKLKSYFINIKE